MTLPAITFYLGWFFAAVVIGQTAIYLFPLKIRGTIAAAAAAVPRIEMPADWHQTGHVRIIYDRFRAPNAVGTNGSSADE